MQKKQEETKIRGKNRTRKKEKIMERKGTSHEKNYYNEAHNFIQKHKDTNNSTKRGRSKNKKKEDILETRKFLQEKRITHYNS